MAGKPKGNMFAAAAQQRQQEQQQIEAAVTGAPAPAQQAGGRLKKRGENATTMTLAISKEDKARVKAWAAQHSTTVSDLLHKWIMENCTD